MKKILFLVAIMLCCATAIFAQNNRISYQAVVRDTANRLVANKTVTVTVNIFNGDAQTAAYSETHTNVQTNYNGLFSLQMGNGTNKSGDWNDIHWKNARVTTAVSLGGTQLATLEMPLTAVPYALYADYAEEINPDAVVVTEIYEKMLADSNALAGQITNLDSKLTDKIHGDSLALAGQINTVNTNLTNKIHQDSVALAGQINTVNSNLTDKIYADSLALGTLIDGNTSEINNLKAVDANMNARMNVISDSVKTNFQNIAINKQAIIDSTAHVRNNLRDTASTLRGLIKNTDDKFANYYTKTQTDINIRDTANTVREEMSAQLATKADANNVYTKAEVDALLAQLVQSLPKMAQDSFTVVTDSLVNFELTNKPDADHVLRMYINGVMVGGSHSGVLTINSTNPKEVVYHPEENKNRDGEAYALKAGDKVTVVYWYVAAITSGN